MVSGGVAYNGGHVGYDPDQDPKLHPPDRDPVGVCEWCHKPAWVRVEIATRSKGKTKAGTARFRAADVRTVCPTHAHSFLAQGAVIQP